MDNGNTYFKTFLIDMPRLGSMFQISNEYND